MSWGIPPKYQQELSFRDKSVELIHQSMVNALINLNFNVTNDGFHLISAEKKLKLTFMSFFVFSKPKVDLTILITKKGRVTFKSRYIYNSSYDTPLNDLGKQKKEITLLVEELNDIVGLNSKYKNREL